jgi:hypothetical protein
MKDLLVLYRLDGGRASENSGVGREAAGLNRACREFCASRGWGGQDQDSGRACVTIDIVR